MNAKSLCLVFVLFSATQAFAWTDGELLIWISSNRPFHALSDIGKTFEKEVGAPVKVETQEKIIDNFQAAAQSGKGPDIFFWANDRIGEWADQITTTAGTREESKRATQATRLITAAH